MFLSAAFHMCSVDYDYCSICLCMHIFLCELFFGYEKHMLSLCFRNNVFSGVIVVDYINIFQNFKTKLNYINHERRAVLKNFV